MDSDPPSSLRGPAKRFFTRLARWQMTRPLVMMAIALASLLVAGSLASQLTLKTSFGELLPQNKESVVIAKKLSKRLPAMATLSIIVRGQDNAALQRFVDDLVPKLNALGPEWVGQAQGGAKQARAFLEKNKLLFADLKVIQKAHDEIHERYEYEVNKAAGFLLDEDDPPPPLTEKSIRQRFQKKGDAGKISKARQRYPDYYSDPNKHIFVVLVRTPVGGTSKRAPELRRRVENIVAATNITTYDPKATVAYTGNFITSAEVYAQVKGDLAHVGFWGGVLILSVVFLFYMRIRTLLAMALTVAIGATWTFGLAYLLIGHLNSSTGFLFSIVVGNGINFGIIYMARYLEERPKQDPLQSAVTAHLGTWLTTLTAAAAASAAYGSLVITNFRGFKHFGIIGGSGMLLCWLATYLFLPSILALFEKVSPVKPATGLAAKLRGLYGRPFAVLSQRFPAALTIGGLLLTAGCVFIVWPSQNSEARDTPACNQRTAGDTSPMVAAQCLLADAMEYNMKNIANHPPKKVSDAVRLSGIVDAIVGRQGQDGRAIVTDRLDQVLPLKKALDALHAKAPKGNKPFEEVVTVFSLIPKNQAKKIDLIERTRKTLTRAKEKGFISDKDWAKVAKLIPKKKLDPITIKQLPRDIARSFMERNGQVGNIVYIVPARGRSVWDGHYLIEFANSFRTTKLPDGSVVKGSGDQVIYADMILAVAEDAPKAIVVSLLATLLIIALAFRLRRDFLWVVAAVAMGFVWMVAVLAIWNTNWSAIGSDAFQFAALRLNFLNFVALPITIGVGADYAGNVMQRYRLQDADLHQVIVETGGAVVLCSLTTTLGYVALTLSINKAINSFGVAAATGEICCVITGVLLLPACLSWLRRRSEAT